MTTDYEDVRWQKPTSLVTTCGHSQGPLFNFLAMIWVVVCFLIGLLGMEVAAWAAHKYLMHGPLWFLHRDHHTPGEGFFERNDWFFLFFALPSMLSIQFGMYLQIYPLAAFGFGILAFGVAYVLVHEILIHRRVALFRMPKKGYWRAVVRRHQQHHQRRNKEEGVNFGMLWVPPSEWR